MYDVEKCELGTGRAWRALNAYGMKALFGYPRRRGGMCIQHNVETSCFGAEWCEHGKVMTPARRQAYVRALVAESRACYVALRCRDGRFSGVLVVSPENVVHTFCVPAEARGAGVGRQLLAHAVAAHGNTDMTLTVAAPLEGRTPCAHAHAVLGRRAPRLVAFYGSYGFVYEGHDADGYVHMRRDALRQLARNVLTYERSGLLGGGIMQQPSTTKGKHMPLGISQRS